MRRFTSAYPPLADVMGNGETELVRLRARLAGRTGGGPRRILVVTDRSWYVLYRGGVQRTIGWEEIHGLHWQRLWHLALLIVRRADPTPPYGDVRDGWTHRFRLHPKELGKLENMLYLRLGNAGGCGDWAHGLPDQVRVDDFNRSPALPLNVPSLRVHVPAPSHDDHHEALGGE